jgi:hypothetical protein
MSTSRKTKPKAKKRNYISESEVIAVVRCPYCLAEKDERCRYRSLRPTRRYPFGVERGAPVAPHRERLTRYRRRLKALKITKTL